MGKKLIGLFGVLVTLFSLFFVFAAIGDLIFGSKTGTSVGVLLGLLVFFSGTSFCGILLARQGFKKGGSNLEQEQIILALAKTAKGRLTVAEVALRCNLSIEDSQAILDKFAAQGVANLQFTDEGNSIYLFSSFLAEPKPALPFDPIQTNYSEPSEPQKNPNRQRALE
jgi:predicted transcriptional regulator